MDAGADHVGRSQLLGQRTMDTVRGAPGASWLIMALAWARAHRTVACSMRAGSGLYPAAPTLSVRFSSERAGRSGRGRADVMLVAKWDSLLVPSRTLVRQGASVRRTRPVAIVPDVAEPVVVDFPVRRPVGHTAPTCRDAHGRNAPGGLAADGPSDLLAASLPSPGTTSAAAVL